MSEVVYTEDEVDSMLSEIRDTYDEEISNLKDDIKDLESRIKALEAKNGTTDLP